MAGLQATLLSAGQEHLLRHFEELDPDQQGSFAKELASVDWPQLAHAFEQTLRPAAGHGQDVDAPDHVLPFNDVQTIEVVYKSILKGIVWSHGMGGGF